MRECETKWAGIRRTEKNECKVPHSPHTPNAYVPFWNRWMVFIRCWRIFNTHSTPVTPSRHLFSSTGSYYRFSLSIYSTSVLQTLCSFAVANHCHKPSTTIIINISFYTLQCVTVWLCVCPFGSTLFVFELVFYFYHVVCLYAWFCFASIASQHNLGAFPKRERGRERESELMDSYAVCTHRVAIHMHMKCIILVCSLHMRIACNEYS